MQGAGCDSGAQTYDIVPQIRRTRVLHVVACIANRAALPKRGFLCLGLMTLQGTCTCERLLGINALMPSLRQCGRAQQVLPVARSQYLIRRERVKRIHCSLAHSSTPVLTGEDWLFVLAPSVQKRPAALRPQAE